MAGMCFYMFLQILPVRNPETNLHLINTCIYTCIYIYIYILYSKVFPGCCQMLKLWFTSSRPGHLCSKTWKFHVLSMIVSYTVNIYQPKKCCSPVPVLPRDMHNSRWTCAKSSKSMDEAMEGLSENGGPPNPMFPIWMDIWLLYGEYMVNIWLIYGLYIPFLNKPKEIPKIVAHTAANSI